MTKRFGENTYREMYRQPGIFNGINLDMENIMAKVRDIFSRGIDQVVFTGCGSSLYLAQSAAHVFGRLNSIPCCAVCCSELYFFPEAYVKGKNVLVVPFTRSSKTSEVRMAVRKVRIMPHVTTLSVTCDPGSAEYNDEMILIRDAAEESIVMTGTFSGMAYVALILSMTVAGKEEEMRRIADGYPQKAEAFLKDCDHVMTEFVKEYPKKDLFISLGQGAFAGMANECMNKIKEMCLCNSEAYPVMEYRHGPMSLADSDTAIIVLGNPATLEEERALIGEMRAFGASVIGCGGEELKDVCDLFIPLSGTDLENMPLASLPGQMLGYHLAAAKGMDCDEPRHLSPAIVIGEEN